MPCACISDLINTLSAFSIELWAHTNSAFPSPAPHNSRLETRNTHPASVIQLYPALKKTKELTDFAEN